MTPGLDAVFWRLGTAARAATLIDTADYFAAAREAMSKATRSIHLLNWAFESRTRLDPAHDDPGVAGDIIGDFLKAAADRGIDVRILCWKSALPVAATQDWFPLQDRVAFRGSKVRFELDGHHPFGACHHQKAIIIDHAVAFCGGADIGQDRWDTAEHLDDDPRRLRPPRLTRCFDSRHEVMALVDGEPAAALAELFRERWRHATGETLDTPPVTPPPMAWPDSIEPEFTDVTVGLARTQAAWRDWPEVRESEALSIASIAAARRTIYMENQYFTSPVVAEALAARLTEPDGPEVVLISTRHSPSWFDRMTMDRTRGDFIRRLRRADRGGRFHIYSPSTRLGRFVIVHAKAAILDNDLIRIGSSNMNNRSTGFDTECDLVLRMETERHRDAAATLRERLVAHWLGCPQAVLREATVDAGSLGAAIEALRAQGHDRLNPIEPRLLTPAARFIAAFHLGDPVGPADSFRPLLRRRRLASQVALTAKTILAVENGAGIEAG